MAYSVALPFFELFIDDSKGLDCTDTLLPQYACHSLCMYDEYDPAQVSLLEHGSCQTVLMYNIAAPTPSSSSLCFAWSLPTVVGPSLVLHRAQTSSCQAFQRWKDKLKNALGMSKPGCLP